MARRGIPRDDISIIHCGIDRQLYSHDPSIPKYDEPTILYLGRLKKYKSVQHLVDAFVQVRKVLPDARLMIVGDGDYRQALEAQAARLGVADAVEFPGFVPTADKVERMRRAHVAVLPSLKEGWGLTNIEANSVGTAVVAANSPGLRDSVRDGETGFLYQYGNITEFAEKLITILTDEPLRKKLEAGALAWAEQFNWDNAARKFERLALDIVEQEP
jgi:glycosyltransferase involved in cell wall biosynthesis